MKPLSWLGRIMLGLSVAALCTSCPVVEPPRQPAGLFPPPPPLPPIAAPTVLATLEQKLADEINLARTQPQTYATFLRRTGAISPETGARRSASRLASRQDLDEALTFLHSTPPVPPLAVSRGMSSGARDLVREQGRTGAFGHRGQDGSRVDSRISRYGLWQGQLSENLSYGFDEARLMTLILIIDEGIPDRSHRHNMFDAQARVLGVACGPHPATQIVCVMIFAEDYTEGVP